MSVPAAAMLPSPAAVDPAAAGAVASAAPAGDEAHASYSECAAQAAQTAHPSRPAPPDPRAAAEPRGAEAPIAGAMLEMLGMVEPPAEPELCPGVEEPDLRGEPREARPFAPAVSVPMPMPMPMLPVLAAAPAGTLDPVDLLAGAGGKGLASAADLIQLAVQQKALTPTQADAASASVQLPLPDFAIPDAARQAASPLAALPAATAPPPLAAMAVPLAPAMDVGPAHPRWAQDLAERVVWSAKEDLGEVEIQLHPPELGPIRMHLKLEGTELAVQVATVHPAARDAFEANLPKLREALQQQGLTLVDAQVSDQTRQSPNANPAADTVHGADDAEAPVAAQTLRLRRIGLLDEYA